MQLQITAASTALFSTWLFIENLGVLFDAGDGVSASLGQKSRKVRHVFVTHADRDHVCGLLQLHQLNASKGTPHIYYPADCGSFPALRDFVKDFDPQSGPATWKGLKGNEIVELPNGYSVAARASTHIEVAQLTKSLDFTIRTERRVLRSEHWHLSGAEIASKRKQLGEAAITEIKIEEVLGYSGDAPELDTARWQKVKILVHEATFLEPDTARRSHSNLPQVISAAAQLKLEALILFHLSARYTTDEIEQAIHGQANKSLPAFPIFAVCPGQVVVDVLNKEPAWRPKSAI
jgi:ribonuclease Z